MLYGHIMQLLMKLLTNPDSLIKRVMAHKPLKDLLQEDAAMTKERERLSELLCLLSDTSDEITAVFKSAVRKLKKGFPKKGRE